MAGRITGSRRRRTVKSRSRNRQHLQQPSGVIAARVAKVGGARFGITSLACQVREHLHLSMPGYSALFDRLLEHRVAMSIARCCNSSQKVVKLGRDGIGKRLREESI